MAVVDGGVLQQQLESTLAASARIRNPSHCHSLPSPATAFIVIVIAFALANWLHVLARLLSSRSFCIHAPAGLLHPICIPFTAFTFSSVVPPLPLP